MAGVFTVSSLLGQPKRNGVRLSTPPVLRGVQMADETPRPTEQAVLMPEASERHRTKMLFVRTVPFFASRKMADCRLTWS